VETADVTTVLFVRHAHTAAIGVELCGRRAGYPLSALGESQSEDLGHALRATPLAAIYSSPLERAQATARAIALHQSCGVDTCTDLNEIDFGRWTGRTFVALDDDPGWHTFNRARGSAVVPDGEQPAAAQERIVRATAQLAAMHRGQIIVLVTHADLVRFALLHYLSRPLDAYDSLTIDPASVTVVTVAPNEATILCVNTDVASLNVPVGRADP
jgi:probable phosphoglycerate mutase